MTIVLPVLSVVFAAFCVWLTVRIANRKERWAKRTLALVVGLPVLYVLGFGPAVWIKSRFFPKRHSADLAIEYVYRPILSRLKYPHNSIADAFDWYGSIGLPKGGVVTFFVPYGDNASRAVTFVSQ
jgi:hypothetical protein